MKHAEAVIREVLAEHGHQFATIKTVVKTIPPASVQVNFNIKEGPTVKVGQIKFAGNQHVNSLLLRRSMVNLKPMGIPYSLIFENLFCEDVRLHASWRKTAERVRQAYRDRGYYAAAVEEPKTQIRDQGGLNWFTFRPNKGKRIDILMPIEEGARYRLGTITFTGNKAITNEKALRAQFALKDGDWFNATLISKGLDNLKKAYGQLGFINFGAIPYAEIRRAEKDRVAEDRHRRGQAVLRLAHRVPGQHHHPRPRHPPRTDAGRRPGLQLAGLGIQPAAPEPAGVLRSR